MKTLPTTLLAVMLACAGCGDDDTAPDGGGSGEGGDSGATGGASGSDAGGLSWFRTCGAPVCGAPGSDEPTGDPPCTAAQQESGRCEDRDAVCDPGIGCSVKLLCTDHDPTMQVGGCPISSARYKRGIRYLSQAEQRELAEQVLALPLARYRYRGASSDREQLGFVIEDVAPSPSVAGDHVDLYGLTSMVVAGLQQQAAELRELHAELAWLRAQVQAPRSCPADARPALKQEP